MVRVVKTVANSLGTLSTVRHRDAVVVGGDGFRSAVGAGVMVCDDDSCFVTVARVMAGDDGC